MRISFATLTVAALSLAAGPAAASAPASESALVITAYDAMDPLRPVIADVTLRCGPTGGSHPDAAGACATLAQVDGDFDALLSLGMFCPEYYAPVAVEVGGKWRDRTVTFEHEYGNRCVAEDQSEGVFQLWRPAQ
jgi:hypothetical protein